MLKTLINISGKKLLIPLYHAVSDDNPPHIRNLYKIKNIKEFNTEIEFILKYFNPIGIDELNDHINNGKPFKRNSVLFTFDDGLREINNVLFPLLLKKGIPAIFFVNTAFVSNKGLFYRYKASLLIEELEKKSMNLKAAAKVLNKVNDDLNTIKKAILNIDYLNKNLLDNIAEKIEFSFSGYLKKEKPYLTLEQLTDIQNKGFSIGAHGISHPEYFKISLKEQLNQTIKSVQWVKDNLQPKYNLFAFPFTDFNVSKEFFDIIFSSNNLDLDLTFGCAGLKDDYHKRHLQRVPMEVGNKVGSKVIVNEYRNYILKKMIFKNKVKRI